MSNKTKKISAALAAALVAAGIAIGAFVNLNKTAVVVTRPSVTAVSKGKSFDLTVALDNSVGFTKGVVGLVLDVSYDSTKLSYSNKAVTLAQGLQNFEVAANEATPGVITVLLNPTGLVNGEFPAVGNGDIFILPFTVKQNAASGSVSFSITSIQGADYAADGSFELVAIKQGSQQAKVTIS